VRAVLERPPGREEGFHQVGDHGWPVVGRRHTRRRRGTV
jgi:hypothetical protein